MGRKEQQLIITLKSDLCAGSGYSCAGIVDSDLCYDIYGIPYIPAKRLKGCLREAAGLIGLTEEETGRIFGKAGQQKAQGVFLGNAYIEGYEELYRELKEAGPAVRNYMTPQNVLDQFTMIKAQTKIMENGVAKDNSLRYTRTIDHYSPLDRERELRFIANVSCTELDAEASENFKNTVKALRNIGLNRNRGLGSVTCELSDPKTADRIRIDFSQVKEDEDYVLTYSVKNLEPLVLNMNYDDITERYISGQTVMGWFVHAYLQEGNSRRYGGIQGTFPEKSGRLQRPVSGGHRDGRHLLSGPVLYKPAEKDKKVCQYNEAASRQAGRLCRGKYRSGICHRRGKPAEETERKIRLFQRGRNSCERSGHRSGLSLYQKIKKAERTGRRTVVLL